MNDDQIFPLISDEQRLELIKRAISSPTGWQSLAQSVRYHNTGKYEEIKAHCIELLRKIAGDKEVDVATPTGDTVKIKFADMLVQQLEYNIALAEATHESK